MLKQQSLTYGACFAALLMLALYVPEAHAQCGVHYAKGQTVYVPVYSHIYAGDRDFPYLLATTVSIRNTDPKNAITISMADYYDTEGKRITGYVEKPVTLRPMASTRYIVKQSDKAGGSGANFLVKWDAATKVNAPIIESIMIGTLTQQGMSFTSRSQVIEEKTD